MATAYTSRVLYHLVGRKHPHSDERNLEILRSILKSMELRTNTVAGHSGGATLVIDPERGSIDGEPIAQTVVCFCDIPFECLGLHTSKYGRVGIGLDRGLVAKWGARPVIYVPTTIDPGAGLNNYFSREVMNVWKGLNDHFPESPTDRSRTVGASATNPEEALDLAGNVISHLLAYVKTFDIDLADDDPFNFYMEREWRKLAKLPLHMPLREIIAPQRYHDELRAEFPYLAHLPHRAPPAG